MMMALLVQELYIQLLHLLQIYQLLVFLALQASPHYGLMLNTPIETKDLN